MTDLRKEAERLYRLRSEARERAIAELPEADRWVVRQHIANIGQARHQKACRFGSGRHPWSRRPSCS